MTTTTATLYDVGADYIDPTGALVEPGPDARRLTFEQACTQARDWFESIPRCIIFLYVRDGEHGGRRIVTDFMDVADIDEYIRWMASDG